MAKQSLKYRDEDRSLDLYLREIGENPLINAAEEVRLARRIKQGDQLEVTDFRSSLASADTITVKNITADFEFQCQLNLSERERKILLAGGKLNHTKETS